MQKYLSIPLFLSFMAQGACALLQGAPGVTLDETEKKRAEREYVGKEYVLSSSMHSRSFFGDPARLYIHARPQDTIDLRQNNGEKAPIGVAEANTIPAGTPVKITQVIFPTVGLEKHFGDDDGSNLQPTGHTWVELVALDQNPAKPMVLVLDPRIDSLRDFHSQITTRLKQPSWVTTWLQYRSQDVLNAIFEKRPVAGMTYPELQAALGWPINADDVEGNSRMSWVADYGDLQITMKSNEVTTFISRKEEAEKQRLIMVEKARIEKEKRDAEEAKRRAEEEARQKAEAERLAKEKAKKEAEAKALAAAKAREEAKRKKAEEARLAKLAKSGRAPVIGGQASGPAIESPSKKKAKKPTPKPAPKAAKPKPVKKGPQPLVLQARFTTVSPDVATAQGRPNTHGALITALKKSGHAANLGMRVNDIVLSLNGNVVKSPDQLKEFIKGLKTDSKLTFQVWRNKALVKVAN